jgi:hypothetical protein
MPFYDSNILGLAIKQTSTLTNQIYLKEQVSNYLFTKYQQQQMKIVKVALIQRHANKSTKNTSNQYDPLC